MRQEHNMHAFTSGCIALRLRISLDKFYAVLLFVSLLLDCMNVHLVFILGADLEVLLAGDGRVQPAACHGRPIRCPVRVL